jgi:hypothetical protein
MHVQGCQSDRTVCVWVGLGGVGGGGGRGQTLTITVRCPPGARVRHDVARGNTFTHTHSHTDDPDAWTALIDSVLGPDYPYFGVIGTHVLARRQERGSR